MKRLSVLAACLLFCVAPTASAQAPSGPVPTKIAPEGLSGSKTASGIRIVSRRPENAFSIELAGKAIRPLSQDRLRWDIDGKTVELELAAFPPGTGQSRPPADLLAAYRAWELRGLDRDGWRPDGGAETLALDGGRQALLWTVRRSGDPAFRHAAAALNNDGVIILSASGAAAGPDAEAKAYLRATLATLKAEAVPAERRRPAQPGDSAFRGTSLDASIHLSSSMFGKRHAALLNNKLMTAADAKLRQAIQVMPAALIETTRFLLASGVNRLIQATVFDGRSAHAINLHGAETDADVFKYWDPWGRGSFLAAESNAAGVDAKPHPSETRMWLVKGDELENVLYALVLPEEDILRTFRMFTLLDGPVERMVEAYAAIQQQDPKDAWIAEANLRKIARYFRSRKAHDAAIATLRVTAALYSASAEAAQELSEAYREAGRQPPAPEQAAAPPAREGDRLEAIKRTDFFTFFHLEQVGPAQRNDRTGHTILMFKPSGEKFRPLVTVALYVGADDLVDQRTLVLTRAFIDDRQQGIFARDIVKSHIAGAVLKEEEPQVTDLVAEIFGRGRAMVAIPASLRAGAQVPNVISPGYSAFRGGLKNYRQRLKHSTLFMENREIEQKPSLLVSVTRHRPPP